MSYSKMEIQIKNRKAVYGNVKVEVGPDEGQGISQVTNVESRGQVDMIKRYTYISAPDVQKTHATLQGSSPKRIVPHHQAHLLG